MKLDQQLIYKQLTDALCAKLTFQNNLLRCLAGSFWGASTNTLRTSALALVYSTAEYATPVWCQSTYSRKIDATLNDTMRIVTGCLRPTPTNLLPVLAGIAPSSLRREKATHRFAQQAVLDENHALTSWSLRRNLVSVKN